MTPEEFRDFALSLPGTEEIRTGGSTKYAAEGRVFAAINEHGDAQLWLEPQECARLVQTAPGFAAQPGAASGPAAVLAIDLAAADGKRLQMTVAAAWGLAASRLV